MRTVKRRRQDVSAASFAEPSGRWPWELHRCLREAETWAAKWLFTDKWMALTLGAVAMLPNPGSSLARTWLRMGSSRTLLRFCLPLPVWETSWTDIFFKSIVHHEESGSLAGHLQRSKNLVICRGLLSSSRWGYVVSQVLPPPRMDRLPTSWCGPGNLWRHHVRERLEPWRLQRKGRGREEVDRSNWQRNGGVFWHSASEHGCLCICVHVCTQMEVNVHTRV
jgi:hypothetical protein